MQKRYYLMHGNEKYSTSLNVPFEGKVKKDFEDIATLDLATMDIKKSEWKKVLAEYNNFFGNTEKATLDDMAYGIEYPYKKNLKAFAPVFKYGKEDLEKYYDILKRYAEIRNWNVQHGKHRTLDIEGDREVLEYLYEIYEDIIDNNLRVEDEKYSLVGKKSMLCDDAKTLILKKNGKKDNRKLSTQEYLYKHTNDLLYLYSRYTELRNLILEYVLYKVGIRCDLGTYIWPAKYWPNEGIYGYIPESRLVLSRQLDLSEFGPIPEVRDDNNKRRH